MSKKVLIIKSATYIDWEDEKKFTEALSESITESGIIYLPYCIDYEFGEIDGVVWEGEKKEEKKPDVDLDLIIRRLEAIKIGAPDSRWGIGYDEGVNDAISNIKALYEKENLNENLRDSEN